MILGVVNADLQAVIRLVVRDAAGQEHEIETVLDTGFNGSLTLPPSLISSLGLPWRSRVGAALANGTVGQFDLHVATVVWEGRPRTLLVAAINTAPLLGMELLKDHDLRVRVRDGGGVQIEAVP